MTPELQLDAFWQSYLATLSEAERAATPDYVLWDFGDTPEVATSVGILVRDGIKTTTSSLFWHLQAIGEAPPQVGEFAIVTDGEGAPLCIIEVTEVEIKPFEDVDAQFAYDYGEGDRTLDGWRIDTWDYFAPYCVEVGRQPSESMPMVCQRFRLVYPR